jgi:hypothetical protein
MSGERFDSGGVLSRAAPVLTFSTLASVEEAEPVRSRADTTPPPVSWNDVQPPRRSSLPVIPRIVRRTRIEQHAVLGPIVRGAVVVRRVGLGTLLFAGLGLATLGSIAGLGMRSLSDEPTIAAMPADPPAFEATAAERLLARAPLALHVEHVVPVQRADTLPAQTAPRAPAVAPRATPAPSRSLPLAHAKKHASSTAVARR